MKSKTKNDPSMTRQQSPKSGLVLLFLGITMAAPLLLDRATFAGMPAWLGGVVSLAALLAALTVLWRSGALRGRFLVLLIAALSLAALAGQFLPGHA